MVLYTYAVNRTGRRNSINGAYLQNKRYLMQEIDRITRLGRDRVGVFLGDKDKSKIKPFIYS